MIFKKKKKNSFLEFSRGDTKYKIEMTDEYIENDAKDIFVKSIYPILTNNLLENNINDEHIITTTIFIIEDMLKDKKFVNEFMKKYNKLLIEISKELTKIHKNKLKENEKNEN